jgi:TonB family protein
MARRRIALGIVLAACFAAGAYAQDQDGTTQPPPFRVARIRVGGNVQGAKIVHQVQPVYPQAAKDAHISGTVRLHIVVAKSGTVQKVEYVSGPQELMQASIDAVQQWRYQPTLINGQPVEVDSTVDVVYTLGGSPPAESQEQPTTDQPKANPPASNPQLKADIIQLFDAMHMQERTATLGRTVFDSLRQRY